MTSESNGKGLISLQAILQPAARRFTYVEVEGWGRFRIKSVNELERSRLEASIKDKQGQLSLNKSLDIKCRVIVLGVVDEDGNPMMSNTHIEQLRLQDAGRLEVLANAIQEHWGLEKKSLEELSKNSEATSGAGSH